MRALYLHIFTMHAYTLQCIQPVRKTYIYCDVFFILVSYLIFLIYLKMLICVVSFFAQIN